MTPPNNSIGVNDTTAVRNLKDYYRTGRDDLGRDFFGPCLKLCTRYDRAAGYFSSTALIVWSASLTRIVRDAVQIRLLVSPELRTADIATLSSVTSIQDRSRFLDTHSDQILAEAMSFASTPENVKGRLLLLAWMISAGQLEIRFAIPRHRASDDVGLFHDKSGIFWFPENLSLAFVGSANETFAAYTKNTERIFVFRSWVDADRGRLEDVRRDFDAMWDSKDDTLLVRPLTEATMAKIRAVTPHDRPWIDDDNPPKPPDDQVERHRWRHQDEAKDKFLERLSGVLEMATGTGKTKTALNICDALIEQDRINGIVISVDGTDLLDQWSRTLLSWIRDRAHPFRLFRQYAQYHQAQSFALNPAQSILVISREQLKSLFSLLPVASRARLLIIHDEVHGLGAPQLRLDLRGQHASFGARLGLSATPEREYDAHGTQFIEDEIGPVLFQFGIEKAIERGILSEFDYVALPYHLTQDDRTRLQGVYAKKAAREKAGNPMSREEVWMELSRVYKTAEEKPLVFAEYLRSNPQVTKGCIVFVEERWYGDDLLPLLAQYTDLYRTYYADDERDNLLRFAAGRIDCLVTCHRISQGIDIQRLRSVVLFSSARSKLETIQRIGRCLRVDPTNPAKRALVVDFVRADEPVNAQFESADAERAKWLTELSKCRRSDDNADR